MRSRLRLPSAIMATLLCGCAMSHSAKRPLVDATVAKTPDEAHGLVKFHEELTRYTTLRDRALRAAPDATPDALAAEIRRKRDGAKQGDVFRHGVQPLFRRAIAEELHDPLAIDTRRTLGEGNPRAALGVEPDADIAPRSVKLVVNELYPEGSSFSTMPPRLLQRLPTLPESVDYRFVGRDLVLLDTRTSLVIDYLPNAVPVGR